MSKAHIPRIPEQYIHPGYLTRKEAICSANEWTQKTDEQHRITKLSDGKWYVYNAVIPKYRMKSILP